MPFAPPQKKLAISSPTAEACPDRFERSSRAGSAMHRGACSAHVTCRALTRHHVDPTRVARARDRLSSAVAPASWLVSSLLTRRNSSACSTSPMARTNYVWLT